MQGRYGSGGHNGSLDGEDAHEGATVLQPVAAAQHRELPACMALWRGGSYDVRGCRAEGAVGRQPAVLDVCRSSAPGEGNYSTRSVRASCSGAVLMSHDYCHVSSATSAQVARKLVVIAAAGGCRGLRPCSPCTVQCRAKFGLTRSSACMKSPHPYGPLIRRSQDCLR